VLKQRFVENQVRKYTSNNTIFSNS